MKKIWIALMLTGVLHAAPVGNTAAPQILEKGFLIPEECWVNLRLGYEELKKKVDSAASDKGLKPVSKALPREQVKK